MSLYKKIIRKIPCSASELSFEVGIGRVRDAKFGEVYSPRIFYWGKTHEAKEFKGAFSTETATDLLFNQPEEVSLNRAKKITAKLRDHYKSSGINVKLIE